MFLVFEKSTILVDSFYKVLFPDSLSWNIISNLILFAPNGSIHVPNAFVTLSPHPLYQSCPLPSSTLSPFKSTAVFSSSSSVAFCGIWRFRRWGGRHRGADDSLILPEKSLPITTIKGCMLLKHGVSSKLWILKCSRISLLRLDLRVKTLSFIQCLSREQKVSFFATIMVLTYSCWLF